VRAAGISRAVLEEETDVENGCASRSNQHGLPQAKLADQLRRDGERENDEAKKLKQTAGPMAPHEIGLVGGLYPS
jgi:hypothetical protein